MKRIFCLLLAILIVFGLAACTAKSSNQPVVPDSNNESDDGETVYTMRLANANAVGDVKDIACNRFKELCNEKSNGRIEIDVFSGGTLGSTADTIEGLAYGTNEIVIEGLSLLAPYCALADIEAVPYMFTSYEEYNKFTSGELWDEFVETIGQEGGFKVLGAMYRGARVTTSKKFFSTPEELAASGLKIRVPNTQMYIKTWETMKTTPTPLDLSDTFTALQQNTVEAQENATVESYGFGFGDVTSYLVKTNHAYSTNVFMFDREYYDALPADIQTILVEAADETSAYINNYMLEKVSEYEGKFAEDGVEIVEVDTTKFAALFDTFVEDNFPQFEDWVGRIKDYVKQ